MQQDDFEQFGNIWASTQEQYGKRPSAGAIRLAFMALSGYELDSVRSALIDHLQDVGVGVYAPKPADIISKIRQGDSEPWEAMIDAIKRIGPYSAVTFDDPAIASAVRTLGGWKAVCSMSYAELDENRAEFAAGYRRAKPGDNPTVKGLDSDGNYLSKDAARLQSLIKQVTNDVH